MTSSHSGGNTASICDRILLHGRPQYSWLSMWCMLSGVANVDLYVRVGEGESSCVLHVVVHVGATKPRAMCTLQQCVKSRLHPIRSNPMLLTDVLGGEKIAWRRLYLLEQVLRLEGIAPARGGTALPCPVWVRIFVGCVGYKLWARDGRRVIKAQLRISCRSQSMSYLVSQTIEHGLLTE